MGALSGYHAADLVSDTSAGVGAEPGDEGVDGERLREAGVGARVGTTSGHRGGGLLSGSRGRGSLRNRAAGGSRTGSSTRPI